MIRIFCAALLLGWLACAHSARAQTPANTELQPPTASFAAIPPAPASVNPIPQPPEPVRAPSAQPTPPPMPLLLPLPMPAVSAPTGARPLTSAQPWTERWYGWQVLAVDASSFGLVALGLVSIGENGGAQPANSLMLVGGGGYFLGAPIIHLAHHRVAAAVGSLALRVVLPVLTGAIGMSEQTCPPPGGGDYGNCGLLGAAEGVVVGALVASVVDATLNSVGAQTLTLDDEQEPKHAPQFGLSPALSADSKRGELRFFGTF